MCITGRTSVADPDVYPGSWILIFSHPRSRISDPKTATKERAEKKLVVKPFFVATNFTKLNIILFLQSWRKKLKPIFKELLKFLPKKLSLSSQKYWFGIRYLGSEIRDPEKTYSGSRIQGSKRHRIPDPDPQHWEEPSKTSRMLNTGRTKLNISDAQHWKYQVKHLGCTTLEEPS